jgi:uncharacterized protein YbjT (DUF2867 family)
MPPPLILVTGATGYIASRLNPRLLDSGYRVRCLAREPLRLKGRSWFRDVEVVQGDVAVPSTLPAALEGVHTAYYLVHNMTYGHGYTARELDSARVFASAAARAGVEHIIYLGGLADPEQHIAPHMRSRIETGRVLREGNVPVTEFRTGVIIGSGSISFEMIRFMTELFPIVPGPSWMKNKSQPIAIQNVIDYLLAALTNPKGRGGVFEIGGPDILSYSDLMLGYARIRGLKRETLLIPGIPLWFMALGVDLMTPVPYPIACALIDGLSADSIVKHPEALETFPNVKLIDFDSATRDALEKTSPIHIERVWEDGGRKPKSIKHEGYFINHREAIIHAEPGKVVRMIVELAGRQSWTVEVNEANQQIIAMIQNQLAGRKWIEWRVGQVANLSYLTQTVFFSPRGLPGFLYWYLLYPFHLISYRGLIKLIARQSGVQ